MRALTFDGHEPRLVPNQPDPVPGDGDALIVPAKVAVGGPDVAVCRGLFGFTGVLGRSFTGRVESICGPDPGGLTGARVVGSTHVVCGACDLCRRGLRTHCREQTVLGLLGRDGCLADRFTLPAENLVVVPDSVDDDHAVFAEPLAAAVQVARQLAVKGKPYITVLGDGTLGLLMAQVMARLNASVRLVGRHAENLGLCERWGIKHRNVKDVGRRADQDVVVDCTGRSEGLALAMQLVRPRGKVVLKSLTPPGLDAAPIDLAPLVVNEIELIGSFSGPVREAVGQIERGEVDVVSLLGRRMRLDDGAAILAAAAEDGARSIVVDV